MLIIILATVVVTIVVSQLSTYGTTIYLHRSMAHKGLKLHPAIAMLMQIELWLFTGIVTREWVAVHRKHHHFSDTEGDPHSPYLKGLWNVLLWNAVYYAREAEKPEVIEKYTRDMPRSRVESVLRRGSLGLLTGLALFVAGYSYFIPGWLGPVLAVISFVIQGMIYVGLNAVINGACHVLGYRNFKNTATNLRLVAWLAGGEGLHNNHHQYPAASKFSMNRKKLEFDPAWLVIRILAKLRLAEPLPLPHINAEAA